MCNYNFERKKACVCKEINPVGSEKVLNRSSCEGGILQGPGDGPYAQVFVFSGGKVRVDPHSGSCTGCREWGS